jgi:hypothetical protein
MNERILELADKAVEDMPSGPWNIPDEFCKKFAELIVRECMKLNSKELSITAIERLLPLYEEHFRVEQ